MIVYDKQLYSFYNLLIYKKDLCLFNNISIVATNCELYNEIFAQYLTTEQMIIDKSFF